MKQRNKYVIYGVAWGLILAIGTASILVFSHFRNQTRVMTQIDEYIHELSLRTSYHVADVFSDKEDAIASISYLYGKGLGPDYNGPDSEGVNYEMLGRLEEDSGFDWIRFVDREGNDYTSQGPRANVSDRDYFISGIAGNAGITFVPVSRVNGQKLVGFYSPVYTDVATLEQNPEPVGVMVGFLQQSTVSSILETNLYEIPVETAIFNHSGAVIGRYGNQTEFALESADLFLDVVAESDRDAFASAIAEGVSARFECAGELGRTIGYVMPVRDTEWTLMQIYPPNVAKASLAKSDKDGILYLSLFAVLAGALATVGFLLVSRMKRMALEVESHQEKERQEAARRKDLDIIQSLSTIYSAVFYVEVKGDRFEMIRFDTEISENALGLGQSGKSSVSAEHFANEFVLPAFANDFLAFTDLSTLPARLVGKHSLSLELQADVKKDGRPMWLECTYIPAKRDTSGNLTHVLFGVSVIDERKTKDLEQKESLQKALGQAQDASKAKTTFLSNMSHDIRTPMNAVLGYANLALEHIDDKEQVVDCLEKLRQAGDNLLDLLNNVLQISRIESGRSVVNNRPCNLSDVNDSIVATFESSIHAKNLHFSYRSDLENPYVHADATKIRQIVTNILSNAIKYTPQGGAVGFSCEESPSKRKDFIHEKIVIVDTGIGISEEFLPYVFDQFEREQSTTEIGIEGTGLGMAIVKKLTTLLGGEVRVDSERGRGTTVTLDLDLRRATPAEVDSIKKRIPAATGQKYPGKRVLAVEDNDLNAEILKQILESRDIEVVRAENGEKAVAMVGESAPGYYDLVFMDIMMPVMNGYEATRRIRGMLDVSKKHIPIVAMTANAFDEDVKKSFEAGMNEHMAKPLDIATLDEILRKYLLG